MDTNDIESTSPETDEVLEEVVEDPEEVVTVSDDYSAILNDINNQLSDIYALLSPQEETETLVTLDQEVSYEVNSLDQVFLFVIIILLGILCFLRGK